MLLRLPRLQLELPWDYELRWQFSAGELEIVNLTAQGMATSDLSGALGLTSSTVKWYWQRIFSKLQVHRRFEVVKVARSRGRVF